MGDILSGNANAGVGNLDSNAIVLTDDVNVDLTLLGVLNGVINNVAQSLVKVI